MEEKNFYKKLSNLLLDLFLLHCKLGLKNNLFEENYNEDINKASGQIINFINEVEILPKESQTGFKIIKDLVEYILFDKFPKNIFQIANSTVNDFLKKFSDANVLNDNELNEFVICSEKYSRNDKSLINRICLERLIGNHLVNLDIFNNYPVFYIIVYFIVKRMSYSDFLTFFPDKDDYNEKFSESFLFKWNENLDLNKEDEITKFVDSLNSKSKRYETNSELLNNLLFFAIIENISIDVKQIVDKDLKTFLMAIIGDEDSDSIIYSVVKDYIERLKSGEVAISLENFKETYKQFVQNFKEETIENIKKDEFKLHINSDKSNKFLCDFLFNLSRDSSDIKQPIINILTRFSDIQTKYYDIKKGEKSYKDNSYNIKSLNNIDYGIRIKKIGLNRNIIDFLSFNLLSGDLNNLLKLYFSSFKFEEYTCKLFCYTDYEFKEEKDKQGNIAHRVDYNKINRNYLTTKYLIKERNMLVHNANHDAVDNLLKLKNKSDLNVFLSDYIEYLDNKKPIFDDCESNDSGNTMSNIPKILNKTMIDIAKELKNKIKNQDKSSREYDSDLKIYLKEFLYEALGLNRQTETDIITLNYKDIVLYLFYCACAFSNECEI